MTPRARLLLGLLVTVTCGCTRELESAPTTPSTATTIPTSSSTPGATSAPTQAPVTAITAPPRTDTLAPGTTAAPTTIPIVTSTVVGVAVAGNSGGVGADSTDSFSEAVRNEDGTCSGWAGRGVTPPWTQGLESGAHFFILARDSGTILGEGTLGTSSFENVGTEREQWNCSFPFEATIDGNPEEFMIKVGDLDPWLVRRDPTNPDRFVTSVNTVPRIDMIPACTATEPVPISVWSSVGLFWSDGLNAVCGAGLTVANLERPCRGPNEGSDHVVKVVDAADPNIVYEDARGLQVDVATLAPGTQVIVLVATGRPCG
jgi:hypothetical protein